MPSHARRLGHRGTPQLENTLQGFSAALEAGLDGVELDVQRSRDGEVVVFHDVDAARIYGDRRRIAELDWPELEALSRGTMRPACRLDEVLASWSPQHQLNIELKTHDWRRPDLELTRAVLERLELWLARETPESSAREGGGTFVLSSFDHRLLEHPMLVARATSGSVERALLLADDSPAFLHAGVGRDIDVEAVHLHAQRCAEPRVQSMIARGLRVGTWGAQSPAEERSLVARGVQRIITDHVHTGAGASRVAPD